MQKYDCNADERFTIGNPGAVYEVDKHRDLRIVGIKQDWLVEPTDSWLWQFGADLRRHNVDYQLHNLVYQDPNDSRQDPLGLYPVETDVSGEQNSSTLGAYVANRATPLLPSIGMSWSW